jgi:hypothetical protein
MTLREPGFVSLAASSKAVSECDPCFADIKKDHAFESGCAAQSA